MIGWLEAGGLVATTVILAIALRASVICGEGGSALMRVLVAGATSVPGLPLLRELNTRGHEVIGVTRSSAKTAQIAAAGAKPVVADVFDAGDIDKVVADVGPEVVVSLLTTLPKLGTQAAQGLRAGEEAVEPRRANLVAAAQRAGVRRVVAESVVFAYGYPTTGPARDGRDAIRIQGRRRKGGDDMLAALRGMEQNVLSSGEHSDTEGIVLRYGVFLRSGCAARRAVRRGWRSGGRCPR